MVTKLSERYERRFWKGYKKYPSFSEVFEYTTQAFRIEINKEIAYLLTVKKVVGRGVRPFGSGKKDAVTKLIEKLRTLNDKRAEIPEEKAKQLRKEGELYRRKVLVYWSDLTDEEIRTISYRIARTKGMSLTSQDKTLIEQIAVGLTKDISENELEQERRVRDKLELNYNMEKERAEKEGRDYFAMKVVKGSAMDYGDIFSDEESVFGKQTKHRTTPFSAREIADTEGAKRGLKQREALREIPYERGSVMYSSLFFLVLIFGAFLWIMLKRLVKTSDKPSSYDPNGMGQVHGGFQTK